MQLYCQSLKGICLCELIGRATFDSESCRGICDKDTAFTRDTAQVAAVPTDGEMAVFDLPDVVACSLQTDGNFLEIAELRHIIMLIHINFLLQKNKPERT